MLDAEPENQSLPELVAPLFNPASFGDATREIPHRILEKLRKEHPLKKVTVPGYAPHWIVTKHKDLKEISRSDDVFKSNLSSKSLVPEAGQELICQYSNGEPNILSTLVHMDDEEHKAHRNVTAQNFLPPAIAAMKPKIEKTAEQWINKLAKKQPECDFAEDIAFHYPLQVVLDIVGVPRKDHPKMLKLAQWLFNFADPDLMRPGANPLDPTEVVKTWDTVLRGFDDYYSKLVAQRREKPKKDVATLLVNAEIDGCPMAHDKLINYFLIFSTAGHDTTAASTATGMWRLAEHPEDLKKLKENPEIIPLFVEESIRWASPVQHFIRRAARDFELSGQTIKEGDRVYLSYLSANFDEDVFEDPYEFKIDRRPNRHLAFGGGAHICIGQHLGRLEMRTFWSKLIPRLESVELAGDAVMANSEFVCGPKRVPIRFNMTS